MHRFLSDSLGYIVCVQQRCLTCFQQDQGVMSSCSTYVTYVTYDAFTKSRVISILFGTYQIGEMAESELVKPKRMIPYPQINDSNSACLSGGRLMGSKFSRPFFGSSPKWLGLKWFPWFPGLQMAMTLCGFTVKMVVFFDPSSTIVKCHRINVRNIGISFWDLIQEKNLVANLRKEPSF